MTDQPSPTAVPAPADWTNAVVAPFDNPLPRFTKRVFTDLAIWMVGLGLLTGVVFPFFVLAFGVPTRYVLTVPFFLATLGAGLLVGATNHWLSSAVVRSRLRFMKSKMSSVEETLRGATYSGDPNGCTPEKCLIPVDSNDEIGDAAASFNHLVEALAMSQRANMVARGFAATISSHIELKALVDGALADLEAAGDFDASGLCILREGELVTAGSNGLVDPDGLAESALVKRCYRTVERLKVELSEEVLVDAGVVTFRPQSILAFPLHIRQVPIGVLLLASGTSVSDDDEQLIQQLLPNFCVALNNALSHERLQRVAAIDPLTGLYNRRFGLERLSQEFSRSVRSKDPLGVILFDVDHFKAVNDTHGHEAGDRVLQTIGDGVKRVLREGDTLFRYGGEEFLAVLPGAGEEDLRHLADRVRRVVEASVVMEGSVEIRVTVSLGAISFPSVDVADVDDLIRKADGAMYNAKKTGRNRLTLVDV